MRDELPRRIKARRGFSVLYRGKTLLSVLDPIAQAERIASRAHLTGRSLYVCFSPLLGYGLSFILKNMSDDSALLCIESDEKLMAFSRSEMDGELLNHPGFRLVSTREPRTLCAYVRSQWGDRAFRRVEVLRLGGGWQLDALCYEGLVRGLKRNIAVDWGNAATLIRLGRRYARNAVRNLALLPRQRTIGDLNFGKAPVLVLGAGPSLDFILEGLKESCGPGRPFRIICVDTALGSLNDFSIAPDLVIALEAQHWNIGDFVGSRGRAFPLAMDLSALPAAAMLLGECFLFSTPWAPLAFLDRLRDAALLPPGLPPLGSVGLSAVALALKLSSGPVLTGGIDFSFTLDAFHAKSAPASLNLLRSRNRLRGFINPEPYVQRGSLDALSKAGRTVRSTISLKHYRDLFEEEFGGEARLADLVSPGLPLGIPCLSLEQALALLSKRTALEVLDQVPPDAAPGRKPAPGTAGVPFEKVRVQNKTEAVLAFVEQELAMLRSLRAALTGEQNRGQRDLELLIDACDYLWAHFPECAGAGGKRPGISAPGDRAGISFLKRVRAELDPFIALFELAARSCGG